METYATRCNLVMHERHRITTIEAGAMKVRLKPNLDCPAAVVAVQTEMDKRLITDCNGGVAREFSHIPSMGPLS